MKLTCLLLFIAIMHVSANTHAQTVTLNATNEPLTNILKQIQKQTGYDYALTGTTIELAKPVTINIKNENLTKALDQIFQNQPLQYQIEDKSIAITPKRPDPIDKLKNTLNSDKIEVHGRVIGDDGLPLSGATVLIKDRKTSTTTDANGYFNLQNVELTETIVISYMGYEKTELPAKPLEGTIKLKLASNPLDAVQIIAYGKTSQRLSTGDVTTVTAKEIEEQPVSNPLLALEGRVPGLIVTQSSGISGDAVKVQIQGQNSIAQGNDPYYVVDGVPYVSQLLGSVQNGIFNGINGNGSPFSFINPNDIESIEILKDADATAIYGSKAANGAILITTKKGKAGQTKVDVNAQTGWGHVTRFLDLLNTQQYLAMRKEAIKNDGFTPDPTYDFDLTAWDTTRNTNWQKALIGGTSQYNDYQATISGGSNTTQFLIGANLHRETTVFPGDLADRKGSIHFNVSNVSTNGKFRISLTGSYLIDNNHLQSTDLTSAAISLAPNAPPVYNANGTLNWADIGGSASWQNPLSYQFNTFQTNANNLTSNAVASYDILPGLDIKSSFGYTNMQTNSYNLSPLSALDPATWYYRQRSSRFGENNNSSWIIEPQITYQKNLGRGSFNILIGSTLQQSTSQLEGTTATGFSSDLLLQDLQAATKVAVLNTYDQNRYNAIFGRLSYNWNDEYLINLTARRDGSSRFGPANQFHDFSAMGLGWIFSKEKFIERSFPFLSFGKLRASYGTTGNDQVGDYSFINLYTASAPQIPYQNSSISFPNGLFNPNLAWELNRKFEAGFELGFLNDRIVGSLAYYRNRTSNELVSTPLPIITGFTSIQENLPAVVQNSGLQIMLNTVNIKSAQFSWKTNFNISITRNKLVAFPDLPNSTYSNQYVIGQPLSMIKVYQFEGVNPTTGVYQFATANGGLTSTPNNPSDLIAVINPTPKYYGGMSNSFAYGNFQLDFFLQFAKQIGSNYSFGFLPGEEGLNQPVTVLNRWQQPGDQANIERFNSDYSLATVDGIARSSTAAYSDASYIRLKNMSLSWKLPRNWDKSLGMENCRLFVQGQNLITLTRYKGLDPENQSTIALPPLRVIVMGFNATF